MTTFRRVTRALVSETGATMIEYALLLSVVAFVAIIAARTLGRVTSAAFGEVARSTCGQGNGQGNNGNGNGNCGGNGANGNGS